MDPVPDGQQASARSDRLHVVAEGHSVPFGYAGKEAANDKDCEEARSEDQGEPLDTVRPLPHGSLFAEPRIAPPKLRAGPIRALDPHAAPSSLLRPTTSSPAGPTTVLPRSRRPGSEAVPRPIGGAEAQRGHGGATTPKRRTSVRVSVPLWADAPGRRRAASRGPKRIARSRTAASSLPGAGEVGKCTASVSEAPVNFPNCPYLVANLRTSPSRGDRDLHRRVRRFRQGAVSHGCRTTHKEPRGADTMASSSEVRGAAARWAMHR